MPTEANWNQHGTGHKEARLLQSPGRTAQTILGLLRGMIVFQFHNTSHTSRMRTRWAVSDARYLKEDGGNLGAFLYYTRENYPKHYTRIVRYLQVLLPFFDDFVLDVEYDKVYLRWREKQCDMQFDASLASDGMLRTMALVALLCQPSERLPNVMFFDEPELGLHPAAINLVSGLMKSVSQHLQVFIATQSTDLLDTFDPEDVVVVERKDRKSTYRRLDAESLEKWLEEYSLGELWAKNVIGGKP
jgi:predicted ATPase